MNIMPFCDFWRGEPKTTMLFKICSKRNLVALSAIVMMSAQSLWAAGNVLKELATRLLVGGQRGQVKPIPSDYDNLRLFCRDVISYCGYVFRRYSLTYLSIRYPYMFLWLSGRPAAIASLARPLAPKCQPHKEEGCYQYHADWL